MNYLGLSVAELDACRGMHTAREIAQQPDLWADIFAQMEQSKEELSQFLTPVLENVNRIILTGAGTSSFIGITLRGLYQRKFGVVTEALATTDIVSHPNDFLIPEIPTLFISFARSGNSPESVAALTLADEIIHSCFHLIITCGSEGKLARESVGKQNRFVIVLPERANDMSLAMTSSYTGMLLAGILLAHFRDLQAERLSVEKLIRYGRTILTDQTPLVSRIAAYDFKRAIFLGSGPLLGTAEEAQLKLQEFTDGKVICKHDSYLGFRHGPKAVVDEKSLLVYFLSNNRYAVQYELDLIRSMRKGTVPLLEVVISKSPVSELKADRMIHLCDDDADMEEEYLAVCFILFAQLVGFFKSIELGLSPDSPSASGSISRVVEGVNIYEMH